MKVVELTAAVQQAAARCRALLTGIAEAAPETGVEDQAFALVALGEVEKRLASRRLKRRVLQTERPNSDEGKR